MPVLAINFLADHFDNVGSNPLSVFLNVVWCDRQGDDPVPVLLILYIQYCYDLGRGGREADL
jgi:hypothetical protein